MKRLLVAGGFRIGDTFHLIPFLRNLSMPDVELHWISGNYERDAVEFLASSTDLKIHGVEIRAEWRRPDNNIDIAAFANSFSCAGANADEIVLVREAHSPQMTPETFVPLKLKETVERGDYIVVQSTSISEWKSCQALSAVAWPFPVKVLHKTGDPNPMVSGGEILRDRPLREIAKLISGARLFVGIHSAMTVLAFYLGTPLVACHFMPGLTKFSQHRFAAEDVFSPTRDEIEKAMGGLLGAGRPA
jgi:hypothetical protein